jgi:dTDP-4-dehydrorhamnose 3,5-epimerase-like enzyme
MDNNTPRVRVTEIPDTGDVRGRSFGVGARLVAHIGTVVDAHLATILPGAIRGNHYHAKRREAILVLYSDSWKLHWDSGEGTAPERREFHGAGAALLDVDPYSAHALENTGAKEMIIIGCCNGPYDERNPDAYRRVITG